MIEARKLILVVFVIAAGLSAVFAAAGRLSFVPGIFLGAGVGVINFLFLQVSVRSMAASQIEPVSTGSMIRLVFGYIARFFVKLIVLAALLFVFVKVIKASWPGLLLGLCIAMAVYIFKVSSINAQRKASCQ